MMKKKNASLPCVAKKVEAITGGQRVKRTNQHGAILTKHGIKPNIPSMDDDRTGSMTGAPSPYERARLKFKD